MNARTAASDVSPQLIHFTLDGNEVAAFDGETICVSKKATEPMATAAPVWWKLMESAAWRPAAVAM